ncbi:MAG: sigma-54-dependent Fis family transcriptional regulator [Verrucomicrobia bacterium]|nr:sigma-54-dependent Fis family transcriptional regulator [Verrucomicrobiota bacterium]
MNKPIVLVADDERGTREGLERALQDRYAVLVAEDGQKALQLLEGRHVDVLITDLKMPGLDGMGLLKRAMALQKPPVCIVMTAYGSIESAVEAMQAGAYHYLTKPNINLDELELVIQRALNTRQIEVENVSLREQLDHKFGMETIVGKSSAMQQVFDIVQQVAPTRATALITGETGTGKELIAHAIHNLSLRKKAPFIAVHAAALPSTLLESELFGHEKGAFTGSVERRIGRFELADGGTLFLDEIGELEPQMQVKLLRVLEERAFERLGGQKTIEVDVRLIAATNKDLRKQVAEGKFRDDLFYRLSVVTIPLPPLRERRDDIPLLVAAFLRQCSEENGKSVTELTPDVINVLMAYDWPGNVRELRNTVEQMVVLARSEKLTLRDVPAVIRGGADLTKIAVVRTGMTVEEAEKELIVQALKELKGNRTKAAEKIGMSRRTLHRKLKRYGLEEL